MSIYSPEWLVAALLELADLLRDSSVEAASEALAGARVPSVGLGGWLAEGALVGGTVSAGVGLVGTSNGGDGSGHSVGASVNFVLEGGASVVGSGGGQRCCAALCWRT